jgi:hypothetical protein
MTNNSYNPLERIVHAKTADGTEIVRYDKAGKWYAEPSEGKRRSISLSEAVDLALSSGSSGADDRHYGGTRFQSEIRKRSKTK